MAINNDLRITPPGELLKEYQTGMPASYDDDFEVTPGGPEKKSGSFSEALDVTPISNTQNLDFGQEAREAGFGRSRYDVDYRPGEDIENERAIAQSGWAKIGTGLTKMGTTALTTFANTTAGTVWGAISAGEELVNQLTDDQEGVSVKKIFNAGVNNPVSEYLTGLQTKADEWFPNYRTTEERTDQYQKEWWKHIATANFIGDSLIKNLGFTIGAMAGGAAWSRAVLQPLLRARTINNILKGAVAATGGDTAANAALAEAAAAVQNGNISIVQAEQLLRNIEKSAKVLNRMDARLQLFGAGISAMGEGSVEGIMSKQEFLDDYNTKVNQAEQAELDGLVQKIFDEGNSKFYVLDSYEMPDGTIRKQKRLSDAGIEELHMREREVEERYQAMRDFANEKGEELASTVFGLNMFILPASNFIQFGKMFAGGWKTARKSLPGIKGEINLAARGTTDDLAKMAIPEITGEYAVKGSKFLRGLGKSAKVAGTEATEEMLQGVASSGGKKVADASLTAYNDSGYDQAQINLFSDEWFKMMSIGGKEYLEDTKNWQEGFLGAVTGLLGMPSFSRAGWSGGIIGSAQEAGQELDASRDAVSKLNSLIKSDEFQERWHSYIRQMKYSDQMDAAVSANDEYAWHTADDNKLISDIMAFDKAGRLNDLKELADEYANIQSQDISSIRSLISKDQSNPYKDEVSKMTDADIAARVKERADKISTAIDRYKEIYDNLSARANTDTSPELMSELLFTANQIKFFEDRFIDVLGKTIEPMKTIIGLDEEYNKQEGKDLNKIQRLERMLNSLTNFYSKSMLPFQTPKFLDTQTNEDLKLLGKMVDEFGSDEQKKQVEDLVKLSQARSEFYKKLATLQTPKGQQKFEEERMSADKVEKKSLEEAAKEEVASFDSVDAVRAEYNKENKRNLGDAEGFVRRMRGVKDTNPNVSKFLDIYDNFADLRSTYIKANGTPSGIEQRVLNYIFDNAQEKEDVINPDKIQTYDEFVKSVREEAAANSGAESRLASVAMMMDVSPETYNATRQKVVDAMNRLSEIKKSTPKPPVTPPKTEEKSTTPTPPAVSGGTDPSSPASVAAGPEKKVATLSEDKQSASDASGRPWKVGDTVYYYDAQKKDVKDYETYTIKELKQDKNDVKAVLVDEGGKERTVSLTWQIPAINVAPPSVAPEANNGPAPVPVKTPEKTELEEDAAKFSKDEKKNDDEKAVSGKKLYFQTAVPEYTMETLKHYRETKAGTDARKEALKALESYPAKHADKKFMQKLISENAFINAVTDVAIGDKVKFIAFADVDKYNGKPVIYMATEKNGQTRVFNVVRRNNPEMYEGLQSFLDAFDKEYNDFISANPNQDFTFSKESTVWAKQPGILEFDYSEGYAGEKPIKHTEGYNPNAPIVWINRKGEYETLRGTTSAEGALSRLLDFSDEEMQKSRGNMYYLADDGLGSFIPIRLGLEHFTENNWQNDNPTFNAIRDVLDNITKITGDAFAKIDAGETRKEREAIIETENKRLHEAVAELRNHLNLTTAFINLGLNKEGKPILIYDRNAAIKGVKREESRKFNGFYLGENNYNQLPEMIAKEHLSLDFYPEGHGETEHKNLASMIENGFITSNATRLLPKNVDVYIYHWENGDFVGTEYQKSKIDGPTSPDPEVAFAQQSGEEPKIPSMPVGFGTAPVRFEEGEIGPTEIAPVRTYDSLSKEQKDAVAEPPYSITDEHKWEFKKGPNGEEVRRTETEKEHILDCVGVL